ncbi:unnamed protein product, partial [Ceratitis capitata]
PRIQSKIEAQTSKLNQNKQFARKPSNQSSNRSTSGAKGGVEETEQKGVRQEQTVAPQWAKWLQWTHILHEQQTLAAIINVRHEMDGTLLESCGEGEIEWHCAQTDRNPQTVKPKPNVLWDQSSSISNSSSTTAHESTEERDWFGLEMTA